MNVRVEIQGTGSYQGFAPVSLIRGDGERICDVDTEYSILARLPIRNPMAVDFFLIASVVYCLDKLVLREDALDCWTRCFSVELPVSNIDVWNTVKTEIDKCLSFLSGDLWDVSFVRQGSRQVCRRVINPLRADAVSLFSGGLDSLIGVIDWLESNKEGKILLVGHHDGKMPGSLSDQNRILGELLSIYKGRISKILLRVGHRQESATKTELTLRARSLLFISMGILVASAIGPGTPLLVPENGTMALNVPLTPSRRGSCSTRTAHPHYLSMLRRVFQSVGIENPFTNPLESKTKGEAVSQCLNRDLLENIAQLSVSCAKRSHKSNFTRRDARECGRCMPCIYRRAALHVVGWDDETYGDDICLGEVNPHDDGDKPQDLRACLRFLKENASNREISRLLLANGSLDAGRLPFYADLIRRAMDEIRALLRDKGTAEIKQLAGVNR